MAIFSSAPFAAPFSPVTELCILNAFNKVGVKSFHTKKSYALFLVLFLSSAPSGRAFSGACRSRPTLYRAEHHTPMGRVLRSCALEPVSGHSVRRGKTSPPLAAQPRSHGMLPVSQAHRHVTMPHHHHTQHGRDGKPKLFCPLSAAAKPSTLAKAATNRRLCVPGPPILEAAVLQK